MRLKGYIVSNDKQPYHRDAIGLLADLSRSTFETLDISIQWFITAPLTPLAL